MEPTGVVLAESFPQNLDVDLEPLLLALAGLGAFFPVVLFQLRFHPGLLRDFYLMLTIKVVDQVSVQHAHGREFVDTRAVDGSGERRVDVMEGVSL